MRLSAFAKGQQLRLMAYKASTGRLASSAAKVVRTRRNVPNRTQARGGALFRELEAQQEERSAAAVESKTPVGKERSSQLGISSVIAGTSGSRSRERCWRTLHADEPGNCLCSKGLAVGAASADCQVPRPEAQSCQCSDRQIRCKAGAAGKGDARSDV